MYFKSHLKRSAWSAPAVMPDHRLRCCCAHINGCSFLIQCTAPVIPVFVNPVHVNKLMYIKRGGKDSVTVPGTIHRISHQGQVEVMMLCRTQTSKWTPPEKNCERDSKRRGNYVYSTVFEFLFLGKETRIKKYNIVITYKDCFSDLWKKNLALVNVYFL